MINLAENIDLSPHVTFEQEYQCLQPGSSTHTALVDIYLERDLEANHLRSKTRP